MFRAAESSRRCSFPIAARPSHIHNLPHYEHPVPESLVPTHESTLIHCVCVLSHVQLFCDPHGLFPIKLLCPWNFSGKNTGVGCCFPPQGIFPTQGSNQWSLVSPALDSLPPVPPGKPYTYTLLSPKVCSLLIHPSPLLVCILWVWRNVWHAPEDFNYPKNPPLPAYSSSPSSSTSGNHWSFSLFS